MSKEPKQPYFNYGQVFIDSLTIFFGFCSIIATIITFIDFEKNIVWASGIFGAASCMSLTLAIKAFIQADTAKAVLRTIECLLLAGLAVVMFVAN